MTVSISDMTVPPQKPEMIQNAQDTVDRITKNSVSYTHLVDKIFFENAERFFRENV